MKQPVPAPENARKPIRYRPIRKVLLYRLLIRWAILAGVAVAFVTLYLVGRQFCDPTEEQLMLGLTVAIYAFIFWQSRVLPRTLSREWTGTVLARDCKKAMRFEKGPASRKIEWTVICKWTVRKDPTDRQKKLDEEGDVEEITYDTEEIWERYFAIGERVRHYKNAKYIVKAHPPVGEENLLCPLCGLVLIQPRCWKCRVDFEEKEDTDSPVS